MQIKSISVPMPGFVYMIGTDQFSWYKIGFSKSCDIRSEQLGVLLPFKIELFAAWKSHDARSLEKAMHEKCGPFHVHGEWFSMSWQIREALIDDKTPIPATLVFPTLEFVRKRPILASSKISSAKNQDSQWKSKRNNAEHEAVRRYMQEHHMDQTKDNYAIAWREAVVEPKRLQRHGRLEML